MKTDCLWAHGVRGRATIAFALFLMLAASAAHAADPAPVVTVETEPLQRGVIAQPVRAYGIVEASSANLTTVDLPYVARVRRMLVQTGQTVRRGAPLFTVTADPAAVLAMQQAKSALTLAQSEAQRTQSLFAQQLATRSQVDTAQKAVADAQAAFSAQSELGVSPQEKAIAAPNDGVITQLSVGQGDQVQAGAAILQMTHAGSAREKAVPNVTLGIDPADAANVHAGDTVTISGLATALARQRVTGSVAMVGASIDGTTQRVNVGAMARFAPGTFLPGTQVSADIATRAGTHWIVPRSAVLTDAHGAYVYQVSTGDKAHRVDVTTSIENGNRYGIDGALVANQPLVVTGNYELHDGEPVHVQNAAHSGSTSQGGAQ